MSELHGGTRVSTIRRMTHSWRMTTSPLSPTACPLIAALSTMFDERWFLMVSRQCCNNSSWVMRVQTRLNLPSTKVVALGCGWVCFSDYNSAFACHGALKNTVHRLYNCGFSAPTFFFMMKQPGFARTICFFIGALEQWNHVHTRMHLIAILLRCKIVMAR